MKLIRLIPFFLIFTFGNAFSYDYHHGLYDRTIALERSVHNLEHRLRHLTGYSHLTADARRLRNSVHRFKHDLNNGRSEWHLRREYNRINARYRHLRHRFYHAHRIHHHHGVQHSLQHVHSHLHRFRHSARHYLHLH